MLNSKKLIIARKKYKLVNLSNKKFIKIKIFITIKDGRKKIKIKGEIEKGGEKNGNFIMAIGKPATIFY